MKKIFTIIILLIFFCNQVAYYLVYTVIRYGETEKIEHHILSTLPENECEIINITLNADKIHWEKEGEVFILNGVMYDVAKTENINGNMYGYCITEKKEMEIMLDYSLEISNAGHSVTDFDLAFCPEFILQNNKANIKKPLVYSLAISSIYKTPLTQRGKDIIVPPPRS